jgi:hypothetical protein
MADTTKPNTSGHDVLGPAGPITYRPVRSAGIDDMIRQLRALASLREQGILSDEEFAEQKARLLR